MASILGVPNCGGATGTFNSGVPACDLIRSTLYGLIGLDAGVGFSSSETATNEAFLAALKEKTRNDRGDRAYPMFVLDNFEDTTKERTKATTGNLSNTEITVADAVPAFAFEHRVGEIFHKKLYNAQNSGLTWMLVDKNYAVYGTMKNNEFTGYSTSDFYVGEPKNATGTELAKYPFDLVFKSITEFKENSQFFQSSSDIAQNSGLNDVILNNEDFTGTVLKVSLKGKGGTDIAQLYDTELAQVGAWVVTEVSTGDPVTATPAYDGSGTPAVFALTLSGTPFTGATPGDKFTVSLAKPSVLTATPINMDGYESNVITVEKPA